jgi:hypothetical protein
MLANIPGADMMQVKDFARHATLVTTLGYVHKIEKPEWANEMGVAFEAFGVYDRDGDEHLGARLLQGDELPREDRLHRPGLPPLRRCRYRPLMPARMLRVRRGARAPGRIESLGI